MDQYYDIEQTKIKIDTIASGQIAQDIQLCNFDTKHGMKHLCQVASSDGNRTWRLIRPLDESSAEEVVFRIQGIICNKLLPPIKFPFRIEPKQRTFLRQAVTISGLGSHIFNNAVQGIHQIHDLFSRTFDAGTIESWTPSIFEDYEAIDMSNRFFTPRQHARTDHITTFSRAVDPDNILHTAMSQDDKFTHTEDNEVEYYELVTDINGLIRYDTVNPIKFRSGDIVEAQVSFVCVPLKDAKYKMLVVLRALTIQDTSPLREAIIRRNRTKNQIVAQVSLKRKVGYSEDEVAEARDRISKMRLD